jgi:hypothetical protein
MKRDLSDITRKRPGKDPRVLQAYAATHDRCACCWLPKRAQRFGWWLELHHIIGGKGGRSDELCNLLMLCTRCHMICEGAKFKQENGEPFPTITFGMILALKCEADPDQFDLTRIAQLYRPNYRNPERWRDCLPDPEPVPAVYLEERNRWR